MVSTAGTTMHQVSDPLSSKQQGPHDQHVAILTMLPPAMLLPGLTFTFLANFQGACIKMARKAYIFVSLSPHLNVSLHIFFFTTALKKMTGQISSNLVCLGKKSIFLKMELIKKDCKSPFFAFTECLLLGRGQDLKKTPHFSK